MSCSHGWKLPPGSPCPDCLWANACSYPRSASGHNRDNVLVAQAAVEAAINLMPTPDTKERIRQIARNQNNWKALKVARNIAQDGT